MQCSARLAGPTEPAGPTRLIVALAKRSWVSSHNDVIFLSCLVLAVTDIEHYFLPESCLYMVPGACWQSWFLQTPELVDVVKVHGGRTSPSALNSQYMLSLS